MDSRPNALILMIDDQEQTEFQALTLMNVLQKECNLKLTNAERFDRGERELDHDILITNLYGVSDE